MRALGILAGNDMPLAQLGAWARSADTILAADGGANALFELGIPPDAIVGDLDSISPETRAAWPVTEVADQSRSDCDKLLALAEQRGLAVITLCGAEGDLPDHFLATLASAAASTIPVRLALRRGLGFVLRGPVARQFEAPIGSRISVIPIEPIFGLALDGMRWATGPDTRLSLSNEAVAGAVGVEFQAGVGFVGIFHPSLESPTWD